MVSTPEGASSGPLVCPDVPRCPRAALSVRTGAHVFANTDALVSGPVRRHDVLPPRMRVAFFAPEDAQIALHVARSFPSARRHRFRSARSHWFRPTQARWFQAASEDAALSRRSCTEFPLCPKALGSLDAMRVHFKTSEDIRQFLRSALSLPDIRRCWVDPTRLHVHFRASEDSRRLLRGRTVFHRRPKAAVSARTACWVPPALARWFSTAPEGTVVRRRSCVPFPRHPKMQGSLDAVRSPCPLSEDTGQILRDARSSTSARRRMLPAARRAGFDLYRVLWILSASEDTAICRSVCVPDVLRPKTLDLIDAVYFAIPAPESVGSVSYGARFSVYIQRHMPINALPACDLGRSPERCPGTEVPGPDPIIPRSQPRPVPSPFPRFSGRGRLTGFLTVGWMPWTYPSEDG